MIYMHGMYCSCKDKIFVMFNLFCECFFSTVKEYRFRMFSYYSCIMHVCFIYIVMCNALFRDVRLVYRAALSFCYDMIGGLWLRSAFFCGCLARCSEIFSDAFKVNAFRWEMFFSVR